MKKYFFIAALLITAAFSLTSCGDDEPKEKTTVTATYTLTFSQDMLDATSIVIYYKADNGRNAFEPITDKWWTKTVTSDKFPAEFGVMYRFSPKTVAELEKEKYDLTFDMNFSYKTSKGASSTNSVSIIDAKGVSKDKVESTLKNFNGKSTGFKVTIDGFVSPANNLKYD